MPRKKERDSKIVKNNRKQLLGKLYQMWQGYEQSKTEGTEYSLSLKEPLSRYDI